MTTRTPAILVKVYYGEKLLEVFSAVSASDSACDEASDVVLLRLGAVGPLLVGVCACAISTRAGDQQRGERLLQTFNEPSETRLGMSKEGYQGKGAALQKGIEIWNSLRTDAQGLLNVGIFHMLEELPVFVDGVGADVTSDLTTRIIFEP